MTSHDLAANKMELSTWIFLYIVGSSVVFYAVTYLMHGRKYKCDSEARLDGKTVIVTGKWIVFCALDTGKNPRRGGRCALQLEFFRPSKVKTHVNRRNNSAHVFKAIKSEL